MGKVELSMLALFGGCCIYIEINMYGWKGWDFMDSEWLELRTS